MQGAWPSRQQDTNNAAGRFCYSTRGEGAMNSLCNYVRNQLMKLFWKTEIFSLFNISNSTVAVQDNSHLTNACISSVYHNLSPISIWLSSYCDVNNNCAGGTHAARRWGTNPFSFFSIKLLS